MDDYIYALDEAGNLTIGDALRFAYSGAGVATLINREGRGYKVALEAVGALRLTKHLNDSFDGLDKVRNLGVLPGPFGESAMEEIVQAEADILEIEPTYPAPALPELAPVKSPAPARKPAKRGPGRPKK